MKCFYHPANDAVGMCSQCGKTACPNCITDIGGAMICASCRSLLQEEEEQIQQEAVVNRGAQIRSAKNRIIWSWVVAGIGLFFGIIAGLVFAFDPKNNANPVLIFLAMAIGYPYMFWSLFWSIPVVWRWIKLFGDKIGFVMVGGNVAVWVIILSFCCAVPFFIALYYGIFGGAIYQFIKYRKIASQSM